VEELIPEELPGPDTAEVSTPRAATALQAALSQKRLIFEYSKRELRPQNLGGKYASALELS